MSGRISKKQNSSYGGEWLTVEEVAEYFKVSPKTVRKWLYQRRLRYYRIGGVVRIRREDMERLPEAVESAEDMIS